MNKIDYSVVKFGVSVVAAVTLALFLMFYVLLDKSQSQSEPVCITRIAQGITK
jgi:hypothetical protein